MLRIAPFNLILTFSAILIGAYSFKPQVPIVDKGVAAHGDGWNVREVNETLCKADSRQFVGHINVTDHKSIFYWFIESEQDPNNRPVILWLNGGPGASSLTGLFSELGPCLLNNNSNDTYSNQHSWSKHANLLFVDQPAGVGFSTTTNSSIWPTTVEEAAEDFSHFLRVFFSEIFPQFAKDGLYIAGESYGGKYVPFYTSSILETQALASEKSPPVEIKGIVLVNAAVEWSNVYTSHYDLFCVSGGSPVHFNQSTCDLIAARSPQCEKLGRLCEITRDTFVCRAALEYCEEKVGVFLQAEVNARKVNPYDLRRDCPHPPVCSSSTGDFGSAQIYLNRDRIQDLLRISPHMKYESINFRLNTAWSETISNLLPTTLEISSILEAGLKILVLNGNFDAAVSTPGNLRVYDSIPWNSQAVYRAETLKDWLWTDNNGLNQKGGQYKSANGLTFVTVDNAGHMCPADQKGAVTTVMKQWLNSKSLDLVAAA